MGKRLSLIIGAVLAILAVFMVRVYLDQQRQAIRSQEEQRLAQVQESQMAILVAKTDIAPGTPVDSSMFEVAVAPANQVPPQVATSFEQVLSKQVVAPIAKGEPIMLTKLSTEMGKRMASASTARAPSLSMTTPEGKRAITIPIDNIASVGGMVKPGDYVDILCSLTIPEESAKKTKGKRENIVPLFQNVLVLAVGSQLIEEAEALAARYAAQQGQQPPPPAPSGGYATITLALSPQEANIIAFAQDQGKIRLVLRSQGDAKVEKTTPANWDSLLNLFMPASTPKKVEEEKTGPEETVEIYRGLKREVVPLTE